jgi:hypothetical protein
MFVMETPNLRLDIQAVILDGLNLRVFEFKRELLVRLLTNTVKSKSDETYIEDFKGGTAKVAIGNSSVACNLLFVNSANST